MTHTDPCWCGGGGGGGGGMEWRVWDGTNYCVLSSNVPGVWCGGKFTVCLLIFRALTPFLEGRAGAHRAAENVVKHTAHRGHLVCLTQIRYNAHGYCGRFVHTKRQPRVVWTQHVSHILRSVCAKSDAPEVGLAVWRERNNQPMMHAKKGRITHTSRRGVIGNERFVLAKRRHT